MSETARRTVLRRGALLATASLAGCTGSDPTAADRDAERRVSLPDAPETGTWPFPGYDAGNTGHNPGATPPRSAPGEVWARSVAEPVTSIVVGPDAVYAGSESETVAVGADGTVRWRLDAGGTLARVDGRLYVADDGVVAVDPATGDRVWEAALDAFHVDAVYEANGTVYVAGSDAVHGLHADTGDRLWRLSTPRNPGLVAGESSPFLVTDESIRELTPGERTDGLLAEPAPVVARTIRTGWRPRPVSPSLVDTSLYVPQYGDPTTSASGAVRRFGLEYGDDRWLTPLRWRGIGAVSVDGDAVYASPYRATTDPPDGSLVALDRATGRERWRHDGAMLGRPAVGDGVVVAGGADPGSPGVCVSSDDDPPTPGASRTAGIDEGRCTDAEPPAATGTLTAFDADSGERLWSVSPGPSFGGYPLALVGNRVYYGDANGVHALE